MIEQLRAHAGAYLPLRVVTAEWSNVSPADSALVLSGGLAVEVFSDTAIDPWVMRFPGMTSVGSPTDPAPRAPGSEPRGGVVPEVAT